MQSELVMSDIEQLDDRTARLFAADCAEHVNHIAIDTHCDAAILAARKYAFGLIDDTALAIAWTNTLVPEGNDVWEVTLALAWVPEEAVRSAARAATRAAASEAADAAVWAA
ncbi:MAG: hypothetical protein L0287_01385, partial [Anaerolineae bacterium]|nr:hypothetical protein [Anaerolineae bacterium]